MKKIILDTNFLLIPALFKVDIFTEIKRITNTKYQLCIIDKTIDELESIKQSKKQKAKDKAAAKFALSIIKRLKIKQLKSEPSEYVDNAILRMAKKTTTIIATQDSKLKTRLKNKSIPTIILRQKKYLILQ